MSTLTCAELLGYPGQTLTEKLISHSAETDPAHEERAHSHAPVQMRAGGASAHRGTLARRIDIRRFPGRDRTERVMHYVRAVFPRAATWSEPAVRELAIRMLCTSEVIE